MATASTDYSSILGLDSQYQTSIEVQDINYTGDTSPVTGSIDAYESWFNNNTKAPDEQTFEKAATSTQTFTWSITEALSIGVEVSATEEVPAVASVTEKVTASLGLSSTQGQTSTATQTWSVSTTITIPANSSVKVVMTISTQTYDVTFTQSVLLQGYVAVTYFISAFQGGVYYIPIQSVFTDCINNNLIDTSGYDILAGGVTTQIAGVFTGSQGVSVGTTATQYPLQSSTDTNSKSVTAKPVSNSSSSTLLAIKKTITKE